MMQSQKLSFTVKCNKEGGRENEACGPLTQHFFFLMHADDSFSCNTCFTSIHNIFFR